jgi:hypothetical protein
MSTHLRSTVVGIFRDRSLAEQALEALTSAGFDRDQIRYSGSGGTSGRFFEGLKSLFTGQEATSGDFASELSNLGVSDEEARYYADEYRNGHAIIAVKATGREQEAQDILQSYAAYNSYSALASPAETAPAVEQPSDSVQSESFTPASEIPSMQQPEAAFQAPPTEQEQAREHPAPASPQAVDSVPPPPSQADVTQQSPQAAVPVAPQPSQAPVAQQSSKADRLQALQAQLQETRQQLQEAQAQLQAAQEREAQIQETQKQLEEAQAQLQETQARLKELNQ